MGSDPIERQAAIDHWRAIIDAVDESNGYDLGFVDGIEFCIDDLSTMPSAEPDIIRCKDCKWWRQQTNYQGSPLSFGFCESDDMWRSLYGETYEVSHIDTDDDFYCGYADMRSNRDES